MQAFGQSGIELKRPLAMKAAIAVQFGDVAKGQKRKFQTVVPKRVGPSEGRSLSQAYCSSELNPDLS